MEFPYKQVFSDAALINKEIDRESFIKLGKIPPEALKKFNTLFCGARIMYSLNPQNSGIGESNDGKRNLQEVHVVEVSIKTKSIGWKELNSFAVTIMQGIPYPMLLIANYKATYYKVFTAEFHNGKVDTNKIIVDTLHCSYWVNIGQCTNSDNTLISKLKTCLQKSSDYKSLIFKWGKSLDWHLNTKQFEQISEYPSQSELKIMEKEGEYYDEIEKHRESFGYE